MAKYQVTVKMKDGSIKKKIVKASANFEEAECEVECYFPGLYCIEDMIRIR